MNQEQFLRIIDERIAKQKEDIVKFAKVAPGYTSGRPSLIFDGETVATSKTYPYAVGLTLAANDEVCLLKGLIICKISRT